MQVNGIIRLLPQKETERLCKKVVRFGFFEAESELPGQAQKIIRAYEFDPQRKGSRIETIIKFPPSPFDTAI